MQHSTIPPALQHLPDWLPVAVRHYLDHTASGTALRALARRDGVSPSTVLRQVRLCEQRRDDPLVDAAFEALRQAAGSSSDPEDAMTAPTRPDALPTDPATLAAEARRVLRRLAEPGAVMAVSSDMPRAVVLRDGAGGAQTRLCTLARSIAQAFAVNDWIAAAGPAQPGARLVAYRITAAGRAALRRLLTEEDMRAGGVREAQFIFAEQHRDMTEREMGTEEGRQRLRVNASESPVSALGRKLDKDGKPYLSHDLVKVAERLREDFELAQMGPRVAQNWERFLTGGDRGAFGSDSGVADGPRAARDRVAEALRDLGPGLGDVALRVCCFLEGVEAAERRLGWAARSGKIVLRIALQRLKRHYDDKVGRTRIG
ncbi:MAG: hypothetical protein RL216_2700 [Pseudomonadota bacterium]|jgi:hypothetical protein